MTQGLLSISYHTIKTSPVDQDLVAVDGLACFNDPESYAGGRFISWQGHPCRTGQRGGARLSLICNDLLGRRVGWRQPPSAVSPSAP